MSILAQMLSNSRYKLLHLIRIFHLKYFRLKKYTNSLLVHKDCFRYCGFIYINSFIQTSIFNKVINITKTFINSKGSSICLIFSNDDNDYFTFFSNLPEFRFYKPSEKNLISNFVVYKMEFIKSYFENNFFFQTNLLVLDFSCGSRLDIITEFNKRKAVILHINSSNFFSKKYTYTLPFTKDNLFLVCVFYLYIRSFYRYESN